MREIDLHAREFRDETLTDVRLVFRGQDVSMSGCTIERCTLALEAEASNTVHFLAGVYRMGGQGALLVEELFEAIRSGRLGATSAIQ